MTIFMLVSATSASRDLLSEVKRQSIVLPVELNNVRTVNGTNAHVKFRCSESREIGTKRRRLEWYRRSTYKGGPFEDAFI